MCLKYGKTSIQVSDKTCHKNAVDYRDIIRTDNDQNHRLSTTNILKDNQYDTIYHEHIRSYSLKSLVYLFALYGINVVDAEIVNRYGGTIRVTVTKKEMDISKNVKNLLEYEKHSGIFEDDIWIKFKKIFK